MADDIDGNEDDIDVNEFDLNASKVDALLYAEKRLLRFLRMLTDEGFFWALSFWESILSLIEI